MRIIALALVLVLSACASPEHQLATGLTNAGLPEGVSTCMARDMTPRLNLTQLMRLRSLGNVAKLDPSATSLDKFLHQVRALKDPEIWSVTSSAALHCTLGLR
jgi:hypothetical protein